MSQQSFEQARQFEQRNAPPSAPPKPPLKQPDFAKVAGFVLIVAAAWALVVLFRSSWDKPIDFRPAIQEEQQTFSHIVIHEKKNIAVDGRSVVGVFQLEELQIPLARARVFWSPAKNTLEIHYFPPPDFKELELNKDQPAVKLFLQFAPLKGRLERERLQSYMIEYLGGKEPLRVLKSFSVQLAAFGEVSPLSGTLKEGEKLRGSLRDTRNEEREGKVLHLNWELTFDTPVEIRR